MDRTPRSVAFAGWGRAELPLRRREHGIVLEPQLRQPNGRYAGQPTPQSRPPEPRHGLGLGLGRPDPSQARDEGAGDPHGGIQRGRGRSRHGAKRSRPGADGRRLRSGRTRPSVREHRPDPLRVAQRGGRDRRPGHEAPLEHELGERFGLLGLDRSRHRPLLFRGGTRGGFGVFSRPPNAARAAPSSSAGGSGRVYSNPAPGMWRP